jgi:hypothetical protein
MYNITYALKKNVKRAINSKPFPWLPPALNGKDRKLNAL